MRALSFLFVVLFTLGFLSPLSQAEGRKVKAQVDASCEQSLLPEQWKPLPHGEKVWGTYTCSSCGLQTSAEPKFGSGTVQEARQQCLGCGAPHTNEPWIEPETRQTADGGLEVLIRRGKSQLVDTALEKAIADKGPQWNCDSCGTANFGPQTRCTSCGKQAHQDGDAAAVRDEAHKIANDVKGARVASRKTLDDVTQLSIQTSAKSNLMRSALIAGGIGLAALTPVAGGGALWWGMQTYEEVGQVVDVRSNAVTIQYGEDLSHAKNLVIVPNAGDDFQIGEEVMIYMRNWDGPKGVEDSKGVAFPVR